MLRVQIENIHRGRRLEKSRIRAIVRRVLRVEGVSAGDITVIFVGMRYCRIINRRFLNHDYATDVLAFPLSEDKHLEAEIYVNMDRAVPQAKEYGVSVANEIARLVIHGTLHLVGYNDTTRKDSRKMRHAEDVHLAHWFD